MPTSGELRADSAQGLLQNAVTRPFERNMSGLWRSGVHRGHKHKVTLPGPEMQRDAAAASAHSTTRANGPAAPPPIFISELFDESGQVYHVTQTLAEGSQGKFRVATRQGRYFGLKEYRLQDKGPAHTSAVTLADIEHEWNAAQACNPKLRVYDVIQYGEKIAVVTELFGPDLLKAAKQISPARRATFVRGAMLDLAEALSEIHAGKYAHLDVKPGNALVASGYVTLSDFGFATQLDPQGLCDASQGTPAFFAPERWRMLQPSKTAQRIDERVDIWALAVTWSHLHQISTPFSYCDGGSLGRTFQCLNTYETFRAQVMTPQGEVRADKIRQHPCTSAASNYDPMGIDDFYRWAKSGLEVDAELFIYLLEGPLQVAPQRRPAMADFASYLRSQMSGRDAKFYGAITKRLSEAARYNLPLKNLRAQSFPQEKPDTKRYTIKEIKSELQLFSQASK